MVLRYQKYLKSYSRKLRSKMTDAERLLWRKIRCKQIRGVQFYRQKPIDQFILDFYAKDPLIGIELDGGQHCKHHGILNDMNRTRSLERLGIKILRFSNLEVIQNCEGVLEVIRATIDELSSVKPS